MPVVDPATNHVYLVVDQATHHQAMNALREHDDEMSICRGIEDVDAGRYSSADEAFARINASFDAKFGE